MNAAHLDPYAPPITQPEPSVPISTGSFSIREAFGAAWGSFVAQPGRAMAAWVLSIVAPAALMFVISALVGFAAEVTGLSKRPVAVNLIWFATQAVALVISTVFAVFMARVALAAARGWRVRFDELTSAQDVAWSAAAATVVSACLTFVGVLALLIPGVVVWLAFWSSPWLIADRRMRAYDALVTSVRVTRGNRARLLAFELACAGVLLAGALALGIGLLVAAPLTILARAHVYLRLTAQLEAAEMDGR